MTSPTSTGVSPAMITSPPRRCSPMQPMIEGVAYFA
jgi:hypothetical protein